MEDLDQTTLIQMVGRAGRQGMSESGVAVLMTSAGNGARFEALLRGQTPVKSVLGSNLKVVLNSEVSASKLF
jgi:replicative superfamily II helicase